ncbi:MAG: hypothetical protein PHX18_03500 [Candidatus Gastranaerophilales bacterium]|nr:hypothetical protein [Candidatus Gastranaerophilales bacterium]
MIGAQYELDRRIISEYKDKNTNATSSAKTLPQELVWDYIEMLSWNNRNVVNMKKNQKQLAS